MGTGRHIGAIYQAVQEIIEGAHPGRAATRIEATQDRQLTMAAELRDPGIDRSQPHQQHQHQGAKAKHGGPRARGALGAGSSPAEAGDGPAPGSAAPG